MSSDIFSRFRGGDQEQGSSSGGGEYGRIREAELLARVDSLPALPLVVQKILGSVGEQGSDAHQLEELISQDMVIAGKVLKLVNSSFYMLPNKVASLQQAVAIIGMRSLRSVVVAVSAADVLSMDLKAYGFAEKGLWINSMATAGIARRACELLKLDADDSDECFVAGLLRDVGMLVLGPVMAEQEVDLQQAGKGADIIDRERTALRFDHCWVGERVSEKWDLPEGVKAAIIRHHRVPSGLDKKELRKLAVVRIAERLAYTAKAGVVDGHPFDTAIDGKLLLAAGFESEDFRQLLEEMPGLVEAAKEEL